MIGSMRFADWRDFLKIFFRSRSFFGFNCFIVVVAVEVEGILGDDTVMLPTSCSSSVK